MGLIDKIENKLSGSHKEDPSSNNSTSSPSSSNRHTSGEHGQQQQYQRGSHEGRTSGGMSDSYQGGNSSSGHHNPLQHPIGSSTGGSGITGGTMKDGVPMSSGHGGSGAGLGSAAAGAGVGGAGAYGASQYGKDVLPSGQTGVHGANVSQTSDQLRDTHLGSGSGQQHNTPREPFDPYSSKGQQTAANAADQRAGYGGYGASQNRAEAGDMGSRSYASGEDVQRSPHGGVTNQVSDLKTGPHSHLENREAVPTAGGQRVGSGSGAGSGNMPGAFDSYESQGQQQHHYGRDAALAGGAGAGGVGAYEAAKHSSHGGPASKTVGPHDSNIANVMDPRVQPDRDNLRHMDSKEHRRDVGMTGAGTGAGAGAAAGYGSSHHPSTHSNTTTSSSSAPYGQNVSYMNKSASADTPLTSTSSTGERYPPGTATTSAPQHDSHHYDSHHYGRDAALAGGAGALGAGGVAAASHHQHQGTGQQGVEHGSLSSSNKTAPGVSSTSAVGGSGHSASRSKGMGSAYEAGYEAGYRDAMEHVKSGASTH